MDKLYRKVGKRYKEVGHEFMGFPSDGIWLVQNGRQNQMCLIGLKEDVPFNALEYRIHADELSLHLVKKFATRSSWFDIAMACCDFFSEKIKRGDG